MVKAKKLILPLLCIGLFMLTIKQNGVIKELQFQIDRQQGELNTAFGFLLEEADFKDVITALEALLDPQMADVRSATREAETKLDYLATYLRQLNNTLFVAGDEYTPLLGRGYPAVTARQAGFQENISQALVAAPNFDNMRNRIFYFDGKLPPRERKFVETSLEETRNIDTQVKSLQQIAARGGYSSQMPSMQDSIKKALIKGLTSSLERLRDANLAYNQLEPVKLEEDEAVTAARRLLEIGDEYKTGGDKLQPGGVKLIRPSFPGRNRYDIEFATYDYKKINVTIDAATGRLLGYSLSGLPQDQYAGKPLDRELRATLLEVARQATRDMGPRLVVLPAGKIYGRERIDVIALSNGLPNLSKRVELGINASEKKVWLYQFKDYYDAEVPAAGSLLSPGKILPALREEKRQLWALSVDPAKPVQVDGAKVRDLVFFFSPNLLKAVPAYVVELSGEKPRLLLVNAVSGKIESFWYPATINTLKRGIKVP